MRDVETLTRPLRKKTIAWVLSVTAIAITILACGFIYLRSHLPTDADFISARIEAISTARGFRLAEARKEGYSDKEIATHLATRNQAEIKETWPLILVAISAAYSVAILGILVLALVRKSGDQTKIP